MDCLWCNQEIIPELSWKNLFQGEKMQSLCMVCVEKLEKLDGERCSRCSRRTNESICFDCKAWENREETDSISWNYSIYTYNGFMQEVVAKWKYRGDYILANMFKEEVVQAYKKKFAFLGKDIIAVPIPLSEGRLHERRFNQAKMIADFLPIETKEVLSRKHGEKQSKKTRKERITMENPFFMTESLNKTVILVDDIYTTGMTLRHAATVLKEHGTPEVYALTLIRG